ncbi:hypothetical protein VFPBJ_08799 [Purpureocillium lilacinum]|uniref:Uncharacterized protein n=1 Tax=Purpureocillium lilacinum TaxID=33203 RepID=A0A179GH31_PURLI|nr:hypothetical protein VFPBJ_08799 [Purpureocillium lilacinum]
MYGVCMRSFVSPQHNTTPFFCTSISCFISQIQDKKKNIRPSIRSVPRTTLPRATWFWSRRPPITLFLSAVHYSHRSSHAWSSLSTPVPGRRRRRAKNKRHHIGEIL